MPHPGRRDDLSKFLVHLTREYTGESAADNLLSILRQRKIEARNPHCLFKYELDRLGLTDVLKRQFNTVCLTETPLTQIRRLTLKTPGRQIQLEGYGVVFYKTTLLRKAASPAVYVNAKGTELRNYLLSRFRCDFDEIKSLKKLKKEQEEFYRSIIQYYSLINIISDHYDFTWEREWRQTGDLDFDYRELVAIIAEDPDEFEERCEQELDHDEFQYVQMLPIISPRWNYEDIVETMSVKLWK